MYHADTFAEQSVHHERQKKIAWFPTVGNKQSSEPQRLELIAARSEDHNAAAKLKAQDDSTRRIPLQMSHSYPVDWTVSNPNVASAHENETISMTVEEQQQQQSQKNKNINNNSNVFPTPPSSSFDPHSKESAYRWKPTSSDFFPNTKTMIDSRRGALQQFRQLCYYTLLRKRVEKRLEILQRERGVDLRKMISNKSQQQQKTTTTTKNRSSSAPSSSASSPQRQQKLLDSESSVGSTGIVLSGLFDPLPNPAAAAPFVLSRELKTQVERKLLEEANRLQFLKDNNQQQNQQNLNLLNKADGPATPINKKEKKSRDSKESKQQQARSSSSDKKSHHASQDSKHSGGQQSGRGHTTFVGEDSAGGGGVVDKNKSTKFSQLFSSVSSNLQLMQPTKISDLETHPQMFFREPFQFKSHRLPHLGFPKHDYVVSGPQNATISFPAGTTEISESTSANIVSGASAHKNINEIAGENTKTIMSGAATATSARGAGAAVKGNRNAIASSDIATTIISEKTTTGGATSATEQQQQKKPPTVSDLLVLPQPSVETFEMPIVAYNKFRPPLLSSSGVNPVLCAKDFPAGYCTQVPAAPLQAARPSPVSNRHEPLKMTLMKFVFAPLPKTMAEADSDDDLSDDEEHDLVDVVPEEIEEDNNNINNTNEHQQLENEQEEKKQNIKTANKNKEVSSTDNKNKPPIPEKPSATYLCSPPFSLDDALKSLNLFSPPIVAGDSENASTSEQQQQDIQRPPSPPTNQRSSQQQKGGGGGKNTPSSLQQQQNQQQQMMSVTAEKLLVEEVKKKKKTSSERLSFAPQPVHSEDAFDVNDSVKKSLKEGGDNLQKSRDMIPSELQHLI